MLPETRKRLGEVLAQRSDTTLQEFVDKIEKFLLTGELQYFYVSDEHEFEQLVGLLGNRSLDRTTVRSYHYQSNSAELLSVQKNEAKLKGVSTVQDVFDWLGDRGMMLEFPNDFSVNMIVDLDSETSVIYQFKTGENTHVCDQCNELEEYNTITGYNRFYSCDHLENTAWSSYVVTLGPYVPDERVDDILTYW